MFNRILAELAAMAGTPGQVMIDATLLKAYRTAASLLKKGPVPRRIRRTKGGLNFKLYVGEHLEVRIRRCGAKKGS